jgi:hypothetical protein
MTPDSSSPAPPPPARRLSLSRRILKGTAVTLAGLLAICLLTVLYWVLRPNSATVDRSRVIDTWTAVADGMHNSNTDLICWHGHFYLIHASSPWHFGSQRCRLDLHRSTDARSWQKVASFQNPGHDIRDPKLAAIGGRLCLYVLKNAGFNPEPYTTALTTSADGTKWTPIEDIEPKGWLFWRPKTCDGKTWYVPAYWNEHGKSILLKSNDGRAWEQVSVIHEGDRNDETDIEFLPDGRLIATARLEITDSVFGEKDACTLVAMAAPPYTRWTSIRDHTTRLDGPCLFAHQGTVYAVGRRNPQTPGPLYRYGSILGKKRTAFYEVRPDGLHYLTDLPSCGDTSYAGVALRGSTAFVSYYTNDIRADYPWILGMLSASEIRIAQIDLARPTGSR